MQDQRIPAVSGHVYEVTRANGRRVWNVKWRDASGQHNKLLGPIWTGKGQPPEGWYRPRTASNNVPADVKAALAEKLTGARRYAVEHVRTAAARAEETGLTFEDAAREWLHVCEHERGLKQSTLVDYRSAVKHVTAAFGPERLEDVTTKRIEDWRNRWVKQHGKQRQAAKLVAILHGIFKLAIRRHGLGTNAAVDVERLPVRYDRTAYDFYSPEQVMALKRAANTEQDGAMYVTAALAGLRRGELIALRWRDVDFAGRTIRVQNNFSHGAVVRPKSGHGRAVPMHDEVARVLAQLGQREHWTGDDDLVFSGELGKHLDGSALRRRYIASLKRAGLPALRFHDLRHTFGSLAIERASIVQVQAWMGHADTKTTMRYLHHKSRGDEADLLNLAIRIDTEPAPIA